MTSLERTLQQLRRRQRQTAALARIGRIALAEGQLQSLFDQTLQLIAETLGNDTSQILKLLPAEEKLLLVSAYGWKGDLIGEATVGISVDSQAGYTLQTSEPVLVQDLRTETRFKTPLLVDQGVISGMSVIIGPEDKPWGVLGTHSRRQVAFEAEDADFILAAATTLWDAIERKRTEERLREADRLRGEFVALLGHELRNPLAAISTALDLARITEEPSALARSRDIVERQVEHLTRLVDDLLEISRIERGVLQLKKRRVDLAELMRTAVADTEHFFKDASYSVTVTIAEEAAFLDVDPVRIVQVISNLLDNAAKYTPGGGKVSLSARPGEGGVTISVQDDGIGIAKERLERIFDMFVTSERSGELRQNGLGIGLPVVKALVEAHGGHVHARSKGPGEGSEFRVWLPWASSREPEADSVPVDRAPPVSEQRVLVVEDNADTAYSLAKLVRLLGHDSRIAHDGVAALEIADGFRPTLVLLDIGLPKLDGYCVARRIREWSWGDKVCLVAVTGWGLDSDRQKTKDAGFDRHETKPVSLATLRDLISAASRDAASSCGKRIRLPRRRTRAEPGPGDQPI